MPRIEIIDIELQQSVEDIIRDDHSRVSAKSIAAIEAMASTKELERSGIAKKVLENKRKTDATYAAVNAVYEHLLAAMESDKMMSGDELLEIAGHTISGLSPLMLKLKKFLKDRDKPQAIQKRQRNGKSCYRLIPYNEPGPPATS